LQANHEVNELGYYGYDGEIEEDVNYKFLKGFS
jgi:hypothetical protein